jgi:hypothetical protein
MSKETTSTRRKSIQVIKDPLLEPFFITKDEYSFTIKQIVESDSEHFRSKGKSKSYEKSLYYYGRLDQAINRIANLKSDLENHDSLKSYMENYQVISDQIEEYTKNLKQLKN